jgi:hypothetical protein
MLTFHRRHIAFHQGKNSSCNKAVATVTLQPKYTVMQNGCQVEKKRENYEITPQKRRSENKW